MTQLHSNIIGSGARNFIILHGFLGMGDNWKTHAKNLAQNGYCVHLVDARNHGRSFWSDQFSYPLMLQDLLNYMDFHHLEDAIFLGHSMGGKTAMSFALQHPHRIEKLVVVDIAPKYYAPHHQQILAGLSTLDFKVLSSRAAAGLHLEKFVTEIGVRQFLLKNLYWIEEGKLGLRPNIAVLKNAAESIGASIASDKQFVKPTLFLQGENSNYINTDSDRQDITRLFPKANITSIKKAGHWLHAENPRDFFDSLTTWLG